MPSIKEHVDRSSNDALHFVFREFASLFRGFLVALRGFFRIAHRILLLIRQCAAATFISGLGLLQLTVTRAAQLYCDAALFCEMSYFAALFPSGAAAAVPSCFCCVYVYSIWLNVNEISPPATCQHRKLEGYVGRDLAHSLGLGE